MKPLPKLADMPVARRRKAPPCRDRFGVILEPPPRVFTKSTAPRNPLVITEFKRYRRDIGADACDVCGWRPPTALFEVAAEQGAAAVLGVVNMLHAHHVVPICAGGADHERNLVLLCPTHHTLAHATGLRTRPGGRWTYQGPSDPVTLVAAVRMLETDPAGWRAYLSTLGAL